jgi:hypothetical protein
MASALSFVTDRTLRFAETVYKMKTSILVFAVTAFAGTAFAQLSVLPPPSSADGTLLQSAGVNAGATHWGNPSNLGAYQIDSSTSGKAVITSPTYNPSGLTFAPTVPTAVTSIINSLNVTGGTVRAIFVGESAGWKNDFGYTYTGNPAGPGSFTVLQNDQVNPAPANVAFGDHIDVLLGKGQASSFDLWLNGVGDGGSAPSQYGGVYTAFNPANSMPYVQSGNVLWAQSALSVSTFVPALGTYANVSTYLVGFEDWRLDRGSDQDFSDLVLAVQFFDVNGQALTDPAVPEPSTYGLIGAAALLGMIVIRRIKSKRA